MYICEWKDALVLSKEIIVPVIIHLAGDAQIIHHFVRGRNEGREEGESGGQIREREQEEVYLTVWKKKRKNGYESMREKVEKGNK